MSDCVDEIDNMKRKCSQIYDMMQTINCSTSSMISFLKIKRYECWKKLLYSDWFIQTLLSYLEIYEITRLDSALCNHGDRNQWLESLRKSVSSIKISRIWYSRFRRGISIENRLDKLLDWMSLKDICLTEFSIWGKQLFICNATMLKLVKNKNNREMRKLEFTGECNMDEECLSYIEKYFQRLEVFLLVVPHQPINDFDDEDEDDENDYIDLELIHDDLCGIIIKNNNLTYLHLENILFSGELFQEIGKFCPFLHSLFIITENGIVGSDNELEIFTKGCSHLKHLTLSVFIHEKLNKLLQCLSNYNPLLETLNLTTFRETKQFQNSNTELLQLLFKNCSPLLDITLNDTLVPRQTS